MTIRRFVFFLMFVIVALMQLTLTACDTAQSRAKKIVSLRAERKLLMDRLYQTYGGSELSQAVNSGLQKEKGTGNSAENQIVQGLANFAQGADRSIFEESVRMVGSGENLITITDKAKQFFARSDVIQYAKRICELDIELAQLETKGNK